MKEKTYVEDINRSIYDFKDEETADKFFKLEGGLTPEIVDQIADEKDDVDFGWRRVAVVCLRVRAKGKRCVGAYRNCRAQRNGVWRGAARLGGDSSCHSEPKNPQQGFGNKQAYLGCHKIRREFEFCKNMGGSS